MSRGTTSVHNLRSLAVALLAVALCAPIARAGDGVGACWGCAEYKCQSGFYAGAMTCEMADLECGWFAKTFLGCKVRYCRTYGECVTSLIDEPREPKIDDDDPTTFSAARRLSPAADDEAGARQVRLPASEL